MTEPVPNPTADPIPPEPEFAGVDDEGPAPPPPTALESLINALLDSGPEVSEHVVRSAQELVLAAQAVIDAVERAVAEQRDLRRPAPDAPEPTATVHPFDRTE